MQTIETTNGLSIRGKRAVHLRAKDSYFDALCDTYLDLGRKITVLSREPAAQGHDIDALINQRENCRDTIVFMLTDEDLSQRPLPH